MKSFQESAESFRAKTHISTIKTPALIGICAIALFVIVLVFQGFWSVLSGDNFEIVKPEDANASADASPQDSNDNSSAVPENSVEEAPSKTIYIHVGGAVVAPGVYQVLEGSRAQVAVNAAGGLREDAAAEAINLARIVVDGEQIIVPTIDEYEKGSVSLPQNPSLSPSHHERININTASLDMLVSLPGIGSVTAEKIIKERENNGPFLLPEDIMRVPGIGEKKYASLADLICV